MAGHSATKQTVLTKQTGIPVREASVANLIRNWWRMCYAGNYSNLKELAAAEAERFGSTKQRGKVEIITSTIRGGLLCPSNATGLLTRSSRGTASKTHLSL